MSEICVFAGTTEGRELCRLLKNTGRETLACVATEYGGKLLEAGGSLTVSAKRLTAEEMETLFRENRFSWVVDATHPYAPIVTENIRSACEKTATPYLRLLRDGGGTVEGAVYAETTEAAVELLHHMDGNILLTTGSKEIGKYAAIPDFSQRVYARVLSVEESITACRNAGLPASHIIAMQGPFSTELNAAMLRNFGATVLVTKDGGLKGGFPQKVAGAAMAGATLLVIGRPPQVAGKPLLEVAAALQLEIKPQVSLVGIGPGNREQLTVGAQSAIENAECIIGAKRMVEAVKTPGQTVIEAIAPEKIVDAIQSHPEYRTFAVVMAGDIGFYSGTKKLLPLLDFCETKCYPGISSLVMLCAKLGTSYEDVVPLSLHGRDGDIVAALRKNRRLFVLVGGENGMGKLCKELTAAGLGDVRISAGEQLGYPAEKISVGTASELENRIFHSLSVALVEWDGHAPVTQGLPDETFLRGHHADGSAVPMTKREIRASALAHLELTADAVCWDIGAGTGSVSIEMAMLCPKGQVYAVEKKEGALSLLKENQKALHVPNLTVVAGSAPEACADLPAPTHVFIGGSSGNIEKILDLAREKNPKVRIVATAIALETLAELTRCMQDWNADCTAVTAANARRVGSYHLMTGQNPVYIFSMQG